MMKAKMKGMVVTLVGLLVACQDDPGTTAQKGAKRPESAPSQITEIKPAVPVGKKVPCATLLDPAKLAPIIVPAIPVVEPPAEEKGKKPKKPAKKEEPGVKKPPDEIVEQKPLEPLPPGELYIQSEDKKGYDDRATAICRVRRGGERLTPEELEKRAGDTPEKRELTILGIIPGDEVCTITAYCSGLYDPKRAKVKCDEEYMELVDDASKIGDFSCMKVVQAGSKDHTVMLVGDPDTRCVYKIQPGPGGTERTLTEACAKAAVDTIGPENLKYE